MAVTPEQYYNDDNLHGNYQYVTLQEILDSMEIESMDDDSYLKGTTRYKMQEHARRAVKFVSRHASRDVLAIEVTVPDNLVWVLPQDFVNYVRISVVTMDANSGARRLEPLDINYNINIAPGYLQDNQWRILFDDQGQVLTADSANAYAFPYQTYEFCEVGGQTRLDTSKLSQNGEFIIDQRRGKIVFSSNMSDKEVVIEYLSDGLQGEFTDTDITIHKDVEQVVRDYIYEACIAMKRNVPANEKVRARQRYLTTLHQAKVDRADISIIEINRAMRTSTMQP